MKSKLKWVYEVKYLAANDENLYPVAFVEGFNHYPFISRVSVFSNKTKARMFLSFALRIFYLDFPEYRHKMNKLYFRISKKLRKVKVK